MMTETSAIQPSYRLTGWCSIDEDRIIDGVRVSVYMGYISDDLFLFCFRIGILVPTSV